MAVHAGVVGKQWVGALLALPLLLFLVCGVGWPLGRLAVRGLSPEGSAALGEVLAAGRYRTALLTSLALSAAAAAVSVLLAVGPAWGLARERFPGRGLLRAAISLPLTFSGLLAGFLITVLVGGTLAAGHLLGVLFASYLYFEVPRAVATLEAAFRRFPHDLDAAARTLGAGPLERFMKIGLPIAAPALRSALVVTFSAALGSFGAVLVLSPNLPVIPLEIYKADGEVAGALALVLAVAALAVDRLLAGEHR